MTRNWSHSVLLGAAVCLVLAVPAYAQSDSVDASSTNAQALLNTYTPADFDRFQPNTALDMVSQIPGFSLRDGDSGSRGFGEASANFLINGRRPSTKSQSARDLLARIPAESVKRLEVLDGASLDIPGLSGQVVNVVARTVDLSGSWRYAARFEEGTAPQLLEGELSVAGERGDLSFNLALDAGQFTFTEDSVETFFDDRPDRGGNVIEDRTEDVFFDNRRPRLSANLSWTPANGHVANLNSRLQYRNNKNGVRETFIARSPDRLSGSSEGNGGEDEWEIDISGDYALPAGPGTLKLIGLYRFEDSDIETRFVNAFDGRDPTRSIFRRDEIEKEIIARTEYAFSLGGVHDVQVSAEYAFNSLDSEALFEDNFTSPQIDNVLVEEDRFEGRVTDSWVLPGDLNLQASIGAEYSSLGVVAPGEEPRTFFRPKGFVAGSWAASDMYTLRTRIEREVGQLDFGDFVSTRSLADEIVTSGNADIIPEQSWNLSFEIERTDPKLLSGRVSPFYERIDDPNDRVLFSDGTEGPGNLDSAERWGIEAEATLLFDTLGITGLRLEAFGLLQDSAIDDPLTGERRPINNDTEYAYELEARYDIPNSQIALFTEFENSQSRPFIRFDEVRNVIVDEPFLEAGVIFKDVYGLQLSVFVQNILNNTIIRERERFFGEGLRLDPITRFERFERDRGRRLNIELSGTF